MFAISPTDIDWFKFLKAKRYNSEVNFWTPTPWNVAQLSQGDKLYFMLKSPIRKIGGYGQFVEYRNMTVENAWNKFGFKNGCTSKQELIARLEKYRAKNSKFNESILDSKIGCLILADIEFFDDDSFLDLEDYEIDFKKHIVKIKYFNEFDPLTAKNLHNVSRFEPLYMTPEKLKKAKILTDRRGQGSFRAKLTCAYENRCCITGEIIPELLEAAHIQPYLNEKSNHVQNGLLLRIDLHRLFDNSLLHIDDNYIITMSPFVKSEYYRNLDGTKINLPKDKNCYPSKEALRSREFEFRNKLI